MEVWILVLQGEFQIFSLHINYAILYSSCFQIIGNRSYTLEELEKLLNTSRNAALRKAFTDYGITSIGRCAGRLAVRDASWVQIWVLVVAALIGVLALIASVAICCCYAR